MPRVVDSDRDARARCAGAIHSDIQRGFIRAEVVHCDTLLSRGSLAACRDTAKLRLEGKDYIVQDGDTINFRHATDSLRRVDAMIKTVVVCEAQVPFIRGGAEAFARTGPRVSRTRLRHRTDQHPVQVVSEGRTAAARGDVALVDLSESNGRPIDLLVATKFPHTSRAIPQGHLARHQQRAAYD
jgi:hypothetical protein